MLFMHNNRLTYWLRFGTSSNLHVGDDKL